MENLGLVQTCVFGDRLILALDKKWLKLNQNQALEFDVTINEKNKLVLSTDLVGGDKTNASTGESTK